MVDAGWRSGSASSHTSFYEILGVAVTADAKEITRAFRLAARESHPDLVPGQEERFKAVAEAHAVLSDPLLRARYDESCRARAQADRAASAGATGGGSDRAPQTAADPSDVTVSVVRFIVNTEHLRGPDRCIDVVGRRGDFHNGFPVRCPDDGSYVLADPGLSPGVYVMQERGPFPPFGGRRGDLIIRYWWPEPIRGLNLLVPVDLPGTWLWERYSFDSPLDGAPVTIAPGTHGGMIVFPGRGFPGEFGGEHGDLVIDLRYVGPLRSRGTHYALRAKALVVAALTILGVFAIVAMLLVIVVVIAVVASR